ncbi:MAG: efflux RND transporter periplasmic adaptor subunit, partial [Terriglobales bacterium]
MKPVASMVLAGGLLLGLTGCSGGGDAAAPTPVVEVQVAPVAQGPLQHWLRSQAVLYPLHQAIITPKISAPVHSFAVNRGDHVQAGELLATLENQDLVAARAEAQGQLQTAQATYDTATAGAIPAALKTAQLDAVAAQQTFANTQRIYESRQKLFAQGAIPRLTLDQAAVDLTNARNADTLAQQRLKAEEAVGHTQALAAAAGDLATAKAHEAAAAAQFSYSEIHSPINGVITDRPVYPGELATPASPLMTIMDLSQVVARAHLPMEQAAQVHVGDKATLSAIGSDQNLNGTVTVVSAATDPGSTTVEVWVQAANPGERFRPGASVNLAILARIIPNAITIPSSALLTDTSGATTVMLAGSDGKAHQQNVTVGVREPDQVQITQGLK